MTNGLIQYVTKEKQKKQSKAAPKVVHEELILTEWEAKKRAELLMEFLARIHPKNTTGGYQNAIEIKFIHRGDGDSSSMGSYFSLYDLNSKKEEELLAEKILEYSKFPHCTYFSGYTYDQNKEVKVKTNKIGKDGKPVYEYRKLHNIVKENAAETQVLAFDLDNVTFEEYLAVKKFINDLGIRFMGGFTGNGYQGFVLLKKRISTKKAYAEFTERLIKLGLPVDGSIKDAPRVFRALFTRNCKQYSSMFTHYKPNAPEAIETKLIEVTDERYHYKDVLDILDKAIEEKGVVTSPKTPSKDVKDKKVVNDTVIVKKDLKKVRIEDREYEKAYVHLIFSELPIQIQNILRGAKVGLRNPSVLYLTPFLNNVLGLSQVKAVETLKTFNNFCPEPQPEEKLISDYHRISENYSQYNRGIYTQDMVEEFGLEELDTEISADFDYVLFDNALIKAFNVMNHTAVQIYLSMKLMEIQDNKKEFTKEEVMASANISERTLERNIGELTKRSFVTSKISNKKRVYKLNIFGTYIDGFTKLSKLLVKDMLNELDSSETALYVYMMYKLSAMKQAKLFVSQKNISQDMGLEQSNISRITDSLKDKGYIKKQTKMTAQKRRKSDYVLRNN